MELHEAVVAQLALLMEKLMRQAAVDEISMRIDERAERPDGRYPVLDSHDGVFRMRLVDADAANAEMADEAREADAMIKTGYGHIALTRTDDPEDVPLSRSALDRLRGLRRSGQL
jgi:hypothetical protein